MLTQKHVSVLFTTLPHLFMHNCSTGKLLMTFYRNFPWPSNTSVLPDFTFLKNKCRLWELLLRLVIQWNILKLALLLPLWLLEAMLNSRRCCILCTSLHVKLPVSFCPLNGIISSLLNFEYYYICLPVIILIFAIFLWRFQPNISFRCQDQTQRLLLCWHQDWLLQLVLKRFT